MTKIDNEVVQRYLLSECKRFINKVCKTELLLENLYTFRFLKEQKYDNYQEHKKNHNEPLINHVKVLKNIEGCVPIELSDVNEEIKKDYYRKSDLFEKMWRKITESNQRIIANLKEIQF